MKVEYNVYGHSSSSDCVRDKQAGARACLSNTSSQLDPPEEAEPEAVSYRSKHVQKYYSKNIQLIVSETPQASAWIPQCSTHPCPSWPPKMSTLPLAPCVINVPPDFLRGYRTTHCQ